MLASLSALFCRYDGFCFNNYVRLGDLIRVAECFKDGKHSYDHEIHVLAEEQPWTAAPANALISDALAFYVRSAGIFAVSGIDRGDLVFRREPALLTNDRTVWHEVIHALQDWERSDACAKSWWRSCSEAHGGRRERFLCENPACPGHGTPSDACEKEWWRSCYEVHDGKCPQFQCENPNCPGHRILFDRTRHLQVDPYYMEGAVQILARGPAQFERRLRGGCARLDPGEARYWWDYIVAQVYWLHHNLRYDYSGRVAETEVYQVWLDNFEHYTGFRVDWKGIFTGYLNGMCHRYVRGIPIRRLLPEPPDELYPLARPAGERPQARMGVLFCRLLGPTNIHLSFLWRDEAAGKRA